MANPLAPKWDPNLQTAQGEAAFDRAAERHFRSHRELPNGKNFTCWNHTVMPGELIKYKQNFDTIFPNAPGAGF